MYYQKVFNEINFDFITLFNIWTFVFYYAKTATSECLILIFDIFIFSENNTTSHSNKSTVSCQTENRIMLQPTPCLKEYSHYLYPDSSSIPVFNNPYGMYIL